MTIDALAPPPITGRDAAAELEGAPFDPSIPARLSSVEDTAPMNADLQSLRDRFENLDIAQARDVTVDAAAQLFGIVESHVEPTTALAFLLGAVAMASGARLALIAAALIAGGAAALAFDVVGALPPWWEALALSLLVVGAVQGALTLLLGEEAAGNVMTAALVTALLFVLWRGPGKLLRLALLAFAPLRRR